MTGSTRLLRGTPLLRGARLLRDARVARLATADRRGRPHAIPICFAFDGRRIYTPIDEKPKRVGPRRLKRVRNVEANPHVALVVDSYREDWRRLWYILVLGEAAIVDPGTPDHATAVRLLKRKYRQYRRMRLEERPVLRIEPDRIVTWPSAMRVQAPGSTRAPRGRR